MSSGLRSKQPSTAAANTPVEVASVLLDDVERAADSNEMVENIFCTLEELSHDEMCVVALVDSGVVGLCHAYVDLVVSTAVRTVEADETQTGIDLLAAMPTRTLELIKSIASVLLNVTACPMKLPQAIEDGILDVIRAAIILNDYEV